MIHSNLWHEGVEYSKHGHIKYTEQITNELFLVNWPAFGITKLWVLEFLFVFIAQPENMRLYGKVVDRTSNTFEQFISLVADAGNHL